jgi:hypothetical protein
MDAELPTGQDAVPELDPKGNGRRLTIPIDLIYGETVSPFERRANGTVSVLVTMNPPRSLPPATLARTLAMVGALPAGGRTFSTPDRISAG